MSVLFVKECDSDNPMDRSDVRIEVQDAHDITAIVQGFSEFLRMCGFEVEEEDGSRK